MSATFLLFPFLVTVVGSIANGTGLGLWGVT